MEKETKKSLIQITFLILLSITIVALILSLVTIVKYQEMAFQDPCFYVKERLGMKSCVCIDKQDFEWNSGVNGSWKQTPKSKTLVPNYGPVDFSNITLG